MKNISQHEGLLVITGRLPQSINGNPRFKGFIDLGNGHGPSWQTSVDSSLAYSVQNFDGKQVSCEIGSYYGKPTISNIKRG